MDVLHVFGPCCEPHILTNMFDRLLMVSCLFDALAESAAIWTWQYGVSRRGTMAGRRSSHGDGQRLVVAVRALRQEDRGP